VIDFIRSRQYLIVNQDLAGFEGAIADDCSGRPGRHPPSLDEIGTCHFLIDKCTPFVVRYHELNGFSSAGHLVAPETSKLIEGNPAFRQGFKKSTLSRGARKANERCVLIATLIRSIEILATGLAGGATRYPPARKKARAVACRIRSKLAGPADRAVSLPANQTKPRRLGHARARSSGSRSFKKLVWEHAACVQFIEHRLH